MAFFLRDDHKLPNEIFSDILLSLQERSEHSDIEIESLKVTIIVASSNNSVISDIDIHYHKKEDGFVEIAFNVNSLLLQWK